VAGLCDRVVVGEGNVTSIETDAAAAERARRALTGTGYAPTLIAADGLRGYPDRAPYDIVIAFCSMRHIPYSLLQQINPGGTLLVTLAGWAEHTDSSASRSRLAAPHRAASSPDTPRS
jgi:protein-L-isoaspartate O-methyltransferase